MNGDPLQSSGSFISLFCIQMIMILLLPRLLHHLVLRHLLQTRVISEIISGIILGPSCLGQLDGFTENVFPSYSKCYLNALGQMGVFFYLFMTGCLANIEQLWKYKIYATTAAFSALGLALAVAPGLTPYMSTSEYTFLTDTQFMLLIVVLAVTSPSVLARILSERGLLTSSLGSICLATATVETFVAFILLAAIIAMYGLSHPWKSPSICNGTVAINPIDAGSSLDPLWIVLVFLGYCVFLLTVGRGIFWFLTQRVYKKGYMEGVVFVTTMMLCFASVWFCQTLTVSTVLGGMCLGILAVPRHGSFCQEVEKALGPITVGVLLPVFFASVGLKTDWTILDSHDVAMAWVLFAVLNGTTFIAAMAVSRFFNGEFSFEGLYFSVMFTCKGLTLLTALGILFTIGILGDRFYSVCVLYAILSCIFVSPIVALIQYIETLYREKHPLQKAGEGEIISHPKVLVIPQTTYLAPIAATVAAWLSCSLEPSTSVQFVRLVDDIDNLEAFMDLFQTPIPPPVLSVDTILGPSQVRWNGMRVQAAVGYQGVLMYPSLEKAYAKMLNGSIRGGRDDLPFTHQIVGYDGTHDSHSVVMTAIHHSEVPLVIVTGHPGIVLAGAKSILVIHSAVNQNSMCTPVLNEFSRAIMELHQKCYLFQLS